MSKVFLNDRNQIRSGWWALIHLSLGIVLGVPLLFLSGFALGKTPAWWGLQPWLLFSAFLIAAWFCLKLQRKPLIEVGLDLNRRWFREFGLGCAFGILIMGFAALMLFLSGGCHWERVAGVGFSALAKGFWMFLAVAFFEEMLFRGYLFQRLVEGMGSWPAMILLALFFGLAHWGNPGMQGAIKMWATLNIALAAILLGLCYLRTRSLALPIGTHLGWNWAQGHLLGFGVSGTQTEHWVQPIFHGKPDWLSGGKFGLEASVLGTAVTVGAIVTLSLWKGSSAPSDDLSTAPEQAFDRSESGASRLKR
jgi:uncharacterized protein